jgi:cytosine/adenosine deaminase-related metal-dependent hydrolase
VDDAAAAEFERLETLNCLGPNTLLVHGIALDQRQRERLDRSRAGLIWCPSSNLQLFGRTADVAWLAARGRVAMGTDSRLSGARDLLEELRRAGQLRAVDEPTLESLVTCDGARLLKLQDRGELRPGARADVLVLPENKPLGMASRADIRLVMSDGMVLYGDKVYAECAACGTDWTDIRVDGRPKILDRDVGEQILRARIAEPGLEMANMTWRAA